MIDERSDVWIMPEDIAQVMLDLVVKNEVSSQKDGLGQAIVIAGGSCIEILAKDRRDVPLLNNVGPSGGVESGSTASDGGKLYQEVLASLKPGWGVPGQANGAH